MIHNQPYMQPEQPPKSHPVLYRHKPLPQTRTLHPGETQSMLSLSRHSGISHNSPMSPHGPSLHELSAQVALLTHKVESQEKRIRDVEGRKQEMATWSSESGMLSQVELNSKQLEPYPSNQQEIISKVREQIEEMNFKKSEVIELVSNQVSNIRSQLTEELVCCFQESLNSKFLQEEQKINQCIQELGKAYERRLTNVSTELEQRLERSNGLTQAALVQLKAKLLDVQNSKKHVIGENLLIVGSRVGVCQLRLGVKWTARREGENVEFLSNETSYFIDRNGVLMDCEMQYIVDGCGDPIRLNAKQMTHLQYLGIFHNKPSLMKNDLF